MAGEGEDGSKGEMSAEESKRAEGKGDDEGTDRQDEKEGEEDGDAGGTHVEENKMRVLVRRGLSSEEGETFKRMILLVQATPRTIKRVVNV